MKHLFEHLFADLWNHWTRPRHESPSAEDLGVGSVVVDGRTTRQRVAIPQIQRTEALAILGKTGQGKSSLLRHLAIQDIEYGRGFLFFDLHGDTTDFLLSQIAAAETRTRRDLSAKLIVIEPGDPAYSIGLNILEPQPGVPVFSQAAEFTQVLKQRWHLDHLGARTEELLRNSLHVLVDNRLTLIEISALLTNQAFRTACLRQSTNPEVTNYFESRFNQQSEAMQTVFRDAILNKTTTFTADPRFRHIVGQQHSTFSLLGSIDNGSWIILNLDKGRLGEQAATLGSLLLTKLKNALFARTQRQLFAVYCDEIQNLVAYEGSGLEILLSEARKFSISITSANQYLDQYPPSMRSAIMAVGTHICFQLSSGDADKMAQALGGTTRLSELLKNLEKRHMVIKSGHRPWQQVVVPDVREPRVDFRDLLRRCRARWCRSRIDIELDIQNRQPQNVGNREVLHDWE